MIRGGINPENNKMFAMVWAGEQMAGLTYEECEKFEIFDVGIRIKGLILTQPKE